MIPLSRAIDQLLLEVDGPILVARLGEKLYSLADGDAYREEVKASGGLVQVLIGHPSARVLFDHPPGSTPPVTSVSGVVDAKDRDRHVDFLTSRSRNDCCESWNVVCKNPVWVASGPPLREICARVPKRPKGIEITMLRLSLQISSPLFHRTIKHPRLVSYLQGYPELFHIREYNGVKHVLYISSGHAHDGRADQLHLLKIIRGLLSQEHNIGLREKAHVVSSMGGKFGNLYPELNARIRSQYGGFSAFVSMHGYRLFGNRSQPHFEEECPRTQIHQANVDLIELLTSTVQRTYAPSTVGEQPLDVIVEVVGSFGKEGVDACAPHLREKIASALGATRTIKSLPLLNYLRAFPSHFQLTKDQRSSLHRVVLIEPQSPESGSSPTIFTVGTAYSSITNGDILLGKDKLWMQLSTAELASASLLGYNHQSWDQGFAPRTCTFAWNDLSETERNAASTLGYTDSSWNAELPPGVLAPGSTSLHHVLPPGLEGLPAVAAPAASTTNTTLSELDLPGAISSTGHSLPTTSDRNESSFGLQRGENIEGLGVLLNGMSAPVQEAAVAFCSESDVSSVPILILAELEDEFISKLRETGLKAGGAQEKVLRKRLAQVPASQ